MADQITAELDAGSLIDAMDRLGNEVLLRHTKGAALVTANNIAAEAQRRIRRRTGTTAAGITVVEDHEREGYVVKMGDVRGPNARQIPGSRRRLSVHTNDAHVGTYLEYGTRDMGAFPFFWQSARLEYGPHDRRMKEAVQDAIDEVGLGD